MLCKNQFYNKSDLTSSESGGVFGEDGPLLPSGNMLMIDRIVMIDDLSGKFKKGYIKAELDIKPDLWFFNCHFINDPVMPGCLGLDAMWQLVGFYLGWIGGKGKGRALGVSKVKFIGQVLPTAKKVTYIIHLKRIIKRKLTVGIADGSVLVDNKLIYIALDLKVGLFKDFHNF